MRRNFSWTATLLLATLAATATAQDTAAKTRLEQSLEQLQAQRTTAARDALQAYEAAFDAQTVMLSDLIVAMNELTAAELDVAKAPADRIKALRSQVDRLGQLYSKIHQLYVVGTRGGEAKEEAHAKTEHLKWQVQLTKELIKLESGDK